MSACGDDEPKDTVREIRMEVSAETGITYYWGDDKKEHPIECMLVKLPDNPDAWQRMAFGTIEGFTYERGHEYYLTYIIHSGAILWTRGGDRVYDWLPSGNSCHERA